MNYSVSKWETSFFGGYEKIIADHPPVEVPYNINFAHEKTDADEINLTFFSKEKLIKLFLLKIVQFDLTETFFYCSEIKEETLFGIFKKKRLYIDRKSVEQTYKATISLDSELGNLFKMFPNLLKESVYSINLPEKKEDNEDAHNGQKKHAKAQMEKIKLKTISRFSGKDALSGTLKDNTQFVTMNKGSKTTYTSEQIQQSGHLVRLLDIKFNPDEDKVPNLKAGKLDMMKLAEVPAGNSHIYYRVEERQTTKPFSVCILADESGSMVGGLKDGYQQHLLKVLYKCFSEIMSPEKIFIFGHSGSDTPEVRVYNDKYNLIFEHTIDQQLENEFCENYDGPVIECVYERVRNQTSDNIIFISISDGEPAGHDYGGQSAIQDLKRVIEKCKRDNFVTVGIGLDFGEIKSIYQYHTIVIDYDKLVPNVSALINRVVKTEFQD